MSEHVDNYATHAGIAKYDTKDGVRWRIRIELPPDPVTGRRRQTSKRGFRTMRDAQRALRELQTKLEQGVSWQATRATLGDYLTDWLTGIAVKPTTLDNYRRCALVYVIPRLGAVRLQALRPEDLDRLYRQLERTGKRDGTGLSPKSVRHVHTMLHRALRDAVDRGYLMRNPADLANPPTARQARARTARDKVWTPDQLRTFLRHVRGDRLYALWHLIATTGMRRGEALGLRWTDIDLDAATLTIAQTLTTADNKLIWSDRAKTDAGERTIALDDTTTAALRTHRRRQASEQLAADTWPHPELVFTWADGTPIYPKSATRIFRRHVDQTGLPSIGIHGLRHTYATAALRAGISPEVLAQRLGHADVAITLSTYAHVLQTDHQHAADTAAAALLDGL